MELIRIPDIMEGVGPLLDRLTLELQDSKRVLWLVSGGSNIALSVAVMRQIPEELSKNLTIYLTDERFGPVGHKDSNAKQLADAGFDPKQARYVEVLAKDLTLEQTCEDYSLSIDAALQNAEVVIAQIGMGPDGHILGVLPGTVAVDSKETVVGYVTEQYTRITLTLESLRQYSTAAYVFAFGVNKRVALADLMTKDLPPEEQPAQILKQLPESYIYNDQIEGEA